MSISKEYYGTAPSGEDVYIYTVDNHRGLKAEFLNLGCVIRRLIVTSDDGIGTDVVLGRDSFEEYVTATGNFGATVGRCANRIRKGIIKIGPDTYYGEPNQKGHLLHSGKANLALRVWEASYDGDDADSISFFVTSPDGDNGFPGNADIRVTFALKDRQLIIHYDAVCDKDTVMSVTNHSYFNLNGHASGDVLGHTLMLCADFMTPFDDEHIPTGEILGVRGTPFDFTEHKQVGRHILSGDIKGYDHNFVLRGTGLREVAYLRGDKTGIAMRTLTDKPGMQIYTPLFLNGTRPYKDGALYDKHQGICLETQFFPNSQEYSHFPSNILKKGVRYDYTTVYSFDFE